MKYLIHYFKSGEATALPMTLTWNGKDLLGLGYPVKFVLQKKQNEIVIRNFSRQTDGKLSLKMIALKAENFRKHLSLSDHGQESIKITPMQEPQAVDYARVSQVPLLALDTSKSVLAEDVRFHKHLKQITIGALVLSLLMIFVHPNFEDTKNEELIPAKYAKLIMTKPKPLSEPIAGSASHSAGQSKAVAKIFQSKAVQQNLRSILKGGLTKYSIMSTGKSIQNLTQKMAIQSALNGAALSQKAGNEIAGANVGAAMVGSGNGYGAGTAANIHGQGTGQADIGLNTQDATVDEGLTKEEVAKVIHSHLSEIRYCYENAILKDPTLAGKVLIDFKINAGGMVPTAAIQEATLTSAQVSGCLMSKLKTWRFPQPRGGVVVAVSYPFIFKSLSR
jgi:hypothetical protein